jgi:hypothetical protein
MTIPLSLSPAQISNNVINYSTSDGMKLYTKATKPQKSKYDGLLEGFHLLLETFCNHVTESNWPANVTVATAARRS